MVDNPSISVADEVERVKDERKTILGRLRRLSEAFVGSHAQREVSEDTMLEAYIRAEQFEKAEDMLRRRLGQRHLAKT